MVKPTSVFDSHEPRWQSITSRSTIELRPLAMTKTKCPAGSLERIADDWTYLSSCSTRQGRLLLTRASTEAVYECERVAAPK
jgi:hypothetical protein